jgi:Tol biopolymer transport system component
MSDRSGAMEIWISDRDGSSRQQLTSLGNAGSPRWSPNSQSIVFDVAQRNGPAIYSVRVTGGSPLLLIASDTHANVCPSFSRDGRWVYFATTRSGNFQVWKVAAEGGTPVQLTHDGGHAAIASSDGKFIYYAKTQYANPEIWEIPTNGGPEKLVSPLLNPVTWAAWSVTKRGIVFAHPSGHGRPAVGLFDLTARRVTNLASLQIPPFWLTASPDARSILFDQPGWRQSQIMLVENFH